MTVAFDAASESHTSGGSRNEASFSWQHTRAGTPTAAVVYTFSDASTDQVAGIQYGGRSMTAITGGRASSTLGDVKTWYIEQGTYAGAWESTPMEFTSGQTMYDVDYGDDGWWVSAGSSYTWFTRDPSVWSRTAAMGTGGSEVMYYNGLWIMVGGTGTIKTATDPSGTWTTRSSGTTQNLYAVAAGNGYVVATGAVGTLVYSTDGGITWQAGNTGETTGAFNSIIYANGYWVAVGNYGNIFYRATTPTGTFTKITPDIYALFYVTRTSGGVWWACGNNGSILTSSNTPPTSWTVTSAGVTTPINRVLELSGEYWAVGDSGVVRKATTGPAGTYSAVNVGGTTAALQATIFADGTHLIIGGTLPQTVLRRHTTAMSSASGGWANVAVTRTNSSATMSGAAVTVTATAPETAGILLESGSQTLTEENIDDQSTGALRIGGVNARLGSVDLSTTTTAADTLVRGANSTAVHALAVTGIDTNYLVSTTALSTTASGTSISSGSTQSATFVVAQTLVRTGLAAGAYDATSQPWTIRIVFSAMSANYATRFKLQRRNSAGTVQTETAYTSERTTSGTFEEVLTWTPGTWAANDQLALVWEHRRPAGSGNQSSTITAGGSSFVNSPTGLNNVYGLVRETVLGAGSRPVGFQSTTSADVAGVYLAVREPPPPAIAWIVGSVARA